MKKSAEAYAKINLYLDILSRRDNGYHDIKGIMQKISLSDTVSVELTPSSKNEIRVTCSNPSVPTDQRNIAYKAAEAYLCEFAGTCYKVDIDIVKRIPAAGGLAGGSTDAAAVLQLMREITGAPSSLAELMPMASRLGADVPFCLAQGSMITEGIGDVLSPVDSLRDCYILITNTGESVSTPEAYSKLDEIYGFFEAASFDEDKFGSLCRGLKEKSLTLVSENMYNIFESVVLEQCSLAKKAKEIILDGGAVGAMMSGSGPTVFGIFASEEKALGAHDALSALGYATHITTPVN